MPRPILAILLLLSLAATPAAPQSQLPRMPGEEDVSDSVPPIEIRGLDIKQNLGARLPLELRFTDSTGATRPLGDYFEDGKPVLLNLGYYHCPMLCPQMETGIINAAREVSLNPGEDYTIISLSIDPSETAADAAAAKADAITQLRMPGAEGGWHFLVGSKENIQPVADIAGFDFKWLPQQEIFSHGAVILFAQADGTISSYLNGVKYPPHQYRLALIDAGNGDIGSPFDQLIMWCTGFNPDAGEYVRLASRIMTLSGAVIFLLLVGIVITLLKLEKNRHRFMPDKTA